MNVLPCPALKSIAALQRLLAVLREQKRKLVTAKMKGANVDAVIEQVTMDIADNERKLAISKSRYVPLFPRLLPALAARK